MSSIASRLKLIKKDSSKEDKILTAMIVSDQFLKRCSPMVDLDLLRTPYAQIVSDWCLTYLEKYDKAPGRHVQDLYETWKKSNKDEHVAELLESFLVRLSSDYEKWEGVNVDYLLDQAEKYFKEQALERLTEDVKAKLVNSDVLGAEAEVARFISPRKESGSIWCDPFNDVELIRRSFTEDVEPLIVFPGPLGKFINNELTRQSFVAFLAPEKRGKCLVRSNRNRVMLSDGTYMGLADLFNERRTDIVSYNEETCFFEKDKIVQFWENGMKPCYRVETVRGTEVFLTGNHPLLTPFGWVNVDNLEIGDLIASVTMVPYEHPVDILDDEYAVWDEIFRIEYMGYLDTVDITVEKNHNFVCNDIVCHNTFWLAEMAIRAYKCRRNVLFLAIGDMSVEQMVRRYHKYLAQKGYKESDRGTVEVPVIDCLWNQLDTCHRRARESLCGVLGVGENGKLAYTKNYQQAESEGYKTCSRCRNRKAPDADDKELFHGAVWKELRQINGPLQWDEGYSIASKMSKGIKGKKFKLASFPTKALNVRGLREHLDILETYDGFVPDVIVIDYVDNMAPMERRKDFRHEVNDTWQELRALSMERHNLVVTATQADAKAYSKKTMGPENFSEDKRKYSHITAVFTLNQDEEDKATGLMRLGKMFVREDEYSLGKQVHVLQCLDIGRPHLDSYWTLQEHDLMKKVMERLEGEKHES